MLRSTNLLLLALLVPVALEAGTVRLSFLNHPAALQETASALANAGCEEPAIATFRTMVDHYNSTLWSVDLGKFPAANDGFYTFTSCTQLLQALPQRLRDVQHPFDFNCYDVVIVLAHGKFRSLHGPDDGPILFLPATFQPAGGPAQAQLLCCQVSTARDAFNLCYPPWYREFAEAYIPPSMADSRINLTAAICCFHALPSSTNTLDPGASVMGALRKDWQSQGIQFPTNLEVVLGHRIIAGLGLVGTTHAGLLFRTGDGYTYLEKQGGCGPYVRLDFTDRQDLLTWFSALYADADGDDVFVTFNDRDIESLKPCVHKKEMLTTDEHR